jgi:transcriptional regulator with XRE-family HTH domain
MSWTRRSVAATILLVTEEQKRAMAARLAARMEEHRLTNEQLAAKAGVSVRTVSRLLNSRHDPRDATVDRVARALGMTPTDFRGPPPKPLGLGEPTQLDRLEAKVDQLLAREDPRAVIERELRDALRRAGALRGVSDAARRPPPRAAQGQ